MSATAILGAVVGVLTVLGGGFALFDRFRKRHSIAEEHWRRLAKKAGHSSEVLELDRKALRLAVKQPDLWFVLLFLEVLRTEIESQHASKLDLHLRTSIGEHVLIKPEDVPDWLSGEVDRIVELTQSSDSVANEAASEAIQKSEKTQNPIHSVVAAQKLGTIYREAIEWGLRVQRVRVNNDYNRLLLLLSHTSLSLLDAIEELAHRVQDQINRLLLIPKRKRNGLILDAHVSVDSKRVEELNDEFDRLSRLLPPD